jgi:toxin FitB
LKGWLLDTNVVAELMSVGGSAEVKDWAVAQPEAGLFISILTLGEYEKGIHQLADGDPMRARHRVTRDGVAMRFARRILPVSNEIIFRWGAIAGRVRRDTGHPPQVVDTLLAATALEHDLYLATRNTRDVANSGALVFNPWTDDPALFPVASL